MKDMKAKKTDEKKTVYTTTDIAKMVGCSQPVVSKVLNGGHGNIGVGPKRREQILAVAASVGYRSNAAARAMRTGRFNCAALLLGTLDQTSLLPIDLFHGLVDALANRQMHMTVAKLPDAKLVSDRVMPNILRDLYADGLLINYNAKIPSKLVEFVDCFHLPAVWINSCQTSDSVYPDDERAMRELTHYFVERGSREIVYVGSGTWHYSSASRREGYEQAMREAGLVSVAMDGGESFSDRLGSLRALLWASKQPKTFLFYNSDEAICFCDLLEEMGLDLGDSIQLGLVSDRVFTYRAKAYPTMVLPEYELGRAAVSMLLRKLENPNEAQPSRAIPCQLETVAPSPEVMD